MVGSVLYLMETVTPELPALSRGCARCGKTLDLERTGSSRRVSGCPTFLNFGKNYQGRGMRFVYVYSRVPTPPTSLLRSHGACAPAQQRLRRRSACEFFVGSDAGPAVTVNGHREAGPVFTLRALPAFARRLMQRLNGIWWQQLPGTSKVRLRNHALYERNKSARCCRSWGAMDHRLFTRPVGRGPQQS